MLLKALKLAMLSDKKKSHPLKERPVIHCNSSSGHSSETLNFHGLSDYIFRDLQTSLAHYNSYEWPLETKTPDYNSSCSDGDSSSAHV